MADSNYGLRHKKQKRSEDEKEHNRLKIDERIRSSKSTLLEQDNKCESLRRSSRKHIDTAIEHSKDTHNVQLRLINGLAGATAKLYKDLGYLDDHQQNDRIHAIEGSSISETVETTLLMQQEQQQGQHQQQPQQQQGQHHQPQPQQQPEQQQGQDQQQPEQQQGQQHQPQPQQQPEQQQGHQQQPQQNQQQWQQQQQPQQQQQGQDQQQPEQQQGQQHQPQPQQHHEPQQKQEQEGIVLNTIWKVLGYLNLKSYTKEGHASTKSYTSDGIDYMHTPIARFLVYADLKECIPTFVVEEIDLGTLISMTKEQIEKIPIKIGPQTRLFNAINKLKSMTDTDLFNIMGMSVEERNAVSMAINDKQQSI